MPREIKVTITGSEEDKRETLKALLEKATTTEFRDIVKSLPMSKVTELARLCHGRMYRQLNCNW